MINWMDWTGKASESLLHFWSNIMFVWTCDNGVTSDSFLHFSVEMICRVRFLQGLEMWLWHCSRGKLFYSLHLIVSRLSLLPWPSRLLAAGLSMALASPCFFSNLPTNHLLPLFFGGSSQMLGPLRDCHVSLFGWINKKNWSENDADPPPLPAEPRPLTAAWAPEAETASADAAAAASRRDCWCSEGKQYKKPVLSTNQIRPLVVPLFQPVDLWHQAICASCTPNQLCQTNQIQSPDTFLVE